MQLSIYVEGKATEVSSGEERIIRVSTGMIGPSVEAVVGAAMMEFVRKALQSSCVPLALTAVKAELLLGHDEEIEPARFKESLQKLFPTLFP